MTECDVCVVRLDEVKPLSERSRRVSCVFVVLAILFGGVGIGGELYLLPEACAQTTTEYPLNIHRFSTTTDALGMITTERAVGLGHLTLNLGLFIDSESKSVEFEGSGGSYPAIESVTSGQLWITFGLWHRITLSFSQQVHISKYNLDGPNGESVQSDDGIGDSSFTLKGVIFDSERSALGVALMMRASLGFSSGLELLTDGAGPTLWPSLVLDKDWRYAGLALNLGYLLRSEQLISPLYVDQAGQALSVIDPIRVGHEATYRAGLSLKYVPSFLHHTFEVLGGIPTQVSDGALRGQRLELISGLKLIFNRGSFLTIGGGRGLIEGYTKPAWRAFMGITFHPKSSDTDGDGIIDDLDECPSEAEDIDQFEDRDGCPEPDNDHDGLNDLYDQCPNQPEDKNDFEDSDGCPDAQRDLDKDGLPDPVDSCPNEPEDMDRFADTDGCPDDDNDNDGLPDRQDRCPNDPEDYDGVEDEDGCPDEDNDKDGIPDQRDRCPMTPEDIDGDADSDGCPEQSSSAVTDSGDKLKIKGKVFFDTAKAVIKPSSYKLLLDIALFLNERPNLTKIEIQGHTDQRGRRSYNINLSEKRAAAVKRFLVKEGSVDPSRLSSKGYGPDQPLVDGDTRAARAKNRRVELVVTGRIDE